MDRAAAAVLLVLGVACTKRNPEYCDESTPCESGSETEPMHFVSTGDPGDFHLADLGSPAIGTGEVIAQPETDVAFDGEARPNPSGSMPDVGADEFYP